MARLSLACAATRGRRTASPAVLGPAGAADAVPASRAGIDAQGANTTNTLRNVSVTCHSPVVFAGKNSVSPARIGCG